MKKRKPMQFALLAVIGLALLTAYSSYSATRPVPSSQPGAAAPQLQLRGLDGQLYTPLTDSRQSPERPAVLHFWASWCEPCHDEAPHINRWHAMYKDQLDVYGINLTARDRLDAVEQFVDKHQVAYPVLLDPAGEAADAYRIAVLPVAYFINAQGVIVDRVIGVPSAGTMERKYEQLLQP